MPNPNSVSRILMMFAASVVAAQNTDALFAAKAEISALLEKGELVKARDAAKRWSQRVPDDISLYGLVADASIALGEYDQAEKAVQWMLDLRPNELDSVIHAALLRFPLGDLDGASEMWNAALRQVGSADAARRTWILKQYAGQQLAAGKPAVAEKLATGATTPSLMGRIRLAQGRYAEAAEALAPGPSYWLAVALDKAGQADAAKAAYAEFEREARARVDRPDNWNRDYVLFLVDTKRDGKEAVRVATLEAGRRRDVYTLDSYAWALFAAGNREKSAKVIDEALAVGIKDAGISAHAATIHAK